MLAEAAIVALASAVSGVPIPGSHSLGPSVGQRLLLTTAQLFELAKDAGLRSDIPTAEAAYRALAENPDARVRSEARFRLARLIAPSGRFAEAAVLLRRILDDQPNAGPVRLELATTLQRMGDEGAALRELRAVRSGDLPLNVARFVDRMSASLQASKPLGFQFEFALAPDSNINRATRSDTLGTVFGDFTIDQEAKARSGVGAAVRGLAQARLPLADGLQIAARASGEANLYRHKDFNDASLDLSAGPELHLGRSRFSAEAGVGQQWYAMKPYQRSLRLSGSATRAVDRVSQLRLDGSARWIDNRLNDLQDGRGLSARVRYERALSPALLVAATVGVDRFAARDDGYSTRSWSAGATVYREIGRMTASAGFEMGRLKADERLQLLPAARADRLTRFQFGVVFRQLTVAGFAPMTRLVIERNRSTVEFYDYKRVRTEFGISRAF